MYYCNNLQARKQLDKLYQNVPHSHIHPRNTRTLQHTPFPEEKKQLLFYYNNFESYWKFISNLTYSFSDECLTAWHMYVGWLVGV